MRDLVALSKKRAVQEMEMFLRNFAHIPDDKLDWTPTPTAKSAIRVAAHTALYAGRFAKMIRERKLPAVENLDEWLAQRTAEEVAITNRTEMERIFREGTEEVIAALDSLSEEEVGMILDSGMGWSLPMTQLMGFAGWHATLHCGQIDYLQTCWDDQEVHLS
ncbi:MAG: DinB family protein [Armatimonadota bacterium]